MNKKALAVFGSAIVVAVVVIVVVSLTSGNSTPPIIKDMRTEANAFPVPAGATVAFPDYSKTSPASYTKGWRSSEPIDTACETWREIYRTWIGDQNLGQVTGNVNAGQSCDFAGPKGSFNVDLQLAVYGTDTSPNVTLTLTQKS